MSNRRSAGNHAHGSSSIPRSLTDRAYRYPIPFRPASLNRSKREWLVGIPRPPPAASCMAIVLSATRVFPVFGLFELVSASLKWSLSTHVRR